jgi:hypothetical protein
LAERKGEEKKVAEVKSVELFVLLGRIAHR